MIFDGEVIYFTNCAEKGRGTDCEILMARSNPEPLNEILRRDPIGAHHRVTYLSSVSAFFH